MFGDIKMVLMSILFLIVGSALGGVITWGVQRVQISDLKREVAVATMEKQTMKEQWEKAINELNETRVTLNDTYAALELLKKYQSVDRDVQKDIDKLDPTFDEDGNATEDTYEEFRRMMEEFNQMQGNLPTASSSDELVILDIKPFVDLRKDAEGLFKEVTNMILEYEK